MFEVSVEQSFAAGHALRNYKGACENVHGHNFKVRVTLEGGGLDSTGLLVDFLDVKQSMRPRLLNSHTEAHESLKEEFQS